MLTRILDRRAAALLLGTSLLAVPAGAEAKEKLDGYLEYKKPPYVIVDGQRVEIGRKTNLDAGKIRDVFDIPLGWHVKARGTRARDGTILATKLAAEKNGSEFMEGEVLAATNQAEKKYVETKKVSDTGPDGKEHLVGKLIDSGPQVDRARRIVDRLLPPYVPKDQVRVYVVDNEAWNAMAMANYSIYVFSGLMKDLDDDELAIVLGHEIAHATHEHSRRQAKGGLIQGIAGVAATIAAQTLDDERARLAAQGATVLGVTTAGNVYSREYEDQADRVGLRYVYEAGYDVDKAPGLWKKFAEKYGDGNKVTNFFFGDHSLARQRAKNLQAEIARNYSNPAKDPPSEAIARLGLRRPEPGLPLKRLEVFDQVTTFLIGQAQAARGVVVADDSRQVGETAVVIEAPLRMSP